MKSIIEYIKESLLDDGNLIVKNIDKDIKQEIKQFLKDNFEGASKCKISKNPNDDGKYVVDCSSYIVVKNRSITSLTTDRFVWGKVEGVFSFCNCRSLKNLEGAPKEVGGNFECYGCESLTSLKGAPKKVGGNFDCAGCESLKSYDVDSKIKGKFIKEW
jgi:hypothetical protein